MPSAAAAPPPPSTGGPSPLDPADLGFPAPFRDPTPVPPPPPPGTQVTLSKSSEEDHTPDLRPCYGSEAARDTDDVRTPDSSDFFLREPESSDKKITLAHEAFTVEQQVQLHAQILISGDLGHARLPKEANMILAFGQPVEGEKHVWEEVWRAALARCHNQKSPFAGLKTPPSSSLIGSCTVEQASKVTTVGKSTVSPHRDSLQDDGDEDDLAELILFGEGSPTAEQDSKDTAVGKTIISEPHSREILSNSLQSDRDEKARQGAESTRTEAAKEHPSDELNVQSAGILPPVSYNEAVQASDDVNGLECGGQSVLDSCLKCGKSGQLLRCCSCPLAAHDSCFGSSRQFDDGQFYCPVCFYSKAAEAYKRAEKRLSEAKKNLSGFFGWKRFAEQQDDQSTSRNQQRAAANYEGDNYLNAHCASNRQDSDHQPKEAANLSRKDEEPCHEEANATRIACPQEVVTGNSEAHQGGNNNSSHEVLQSPIANQNIVAHKESGLMSSPNCEFSAKIGATSARNMSRRKVSFKEKGIAVSNSYGKASGRQDQYVQSPARRRYYPYPPECYSTPARSPLAPRRKSFVSTARRPHVRWTAEEEAALREGVARFARKGKGYISWIRILKHGNDMFDPSRLPEDLKQKWNRMKKKDNVAHEGAGLACLDKKTRRLSEIFRVVP